MSAGFTPAPWRVDGFRMVSGEKVNVAQAIATNGDYETAEANARLIAAAPELYEALQALMSADIVDASSDALELAGRALAKARGEQVSA